MSGCLVILSGPSGVGKDTVLAAWQQKNPRVRRVIAYTTRAPRAGEVDGVDYHFVSADQFLAKAERGDFLEHKLVHGNYYATPLVDMEALLTEGAIAVLKIDVQGACEVMDIRPDAISIFLEPPTWEELRQRILGRATDSDEQIARRLANAEYEMSLRDRYRHRVVNRTVPETVQQLDELVAL